MSGCMQRDMDPPIFHTFLGKELTRGEGLPLVPVPLLSASPLLIVLLITVLLTVTTCRLSTAEGSAECKKSEQEGPSENGVVEEEGRVQRDVVRASAREHCPSIALLLLDPVDVDRGGGHEAKQGQEEEQCE